MASLTHAEKCIASPEAMEIQLDRQAMLEEWTLSSTFADRAMAKNLAEKF